MNATVAYALRADFEGTVSQAVTELDDEGKLVETGEVVEVDKFLGGLINAGDRELDVKAELEEGGGRIVVLASDTGAIDALNAFPALKRVGSEEGEEAVLVPYPNRNRDALRDEATSRGIEGAGGANKDPLVYALEEHDLRTAEGTLGEVELNIDALAAARLEREGA
jgi:hypothetical protein